MAAASPGLVVAAVLADRPDADVTLVESDTRKAAFLREAARIVELPVTVLPARIEQVAPRIAAGVEVVSARALAPLPKLLPLAEPFIAQERWDCFSKGQDVDNELTEATKSWNVDASVVESRTDRSGRVLIVRRAERIATEAASQSSVTPRTDAMTELSSSHLSSSPAGAPRVLALANQKGGVGKTTHGHQSRHRPGRDRRDGADRRSRSAGQCLDRSRH